MYDVAHSRTIIMNSGANPPLLHALMQHCDQPYTAINAFTYMPLPACLIFLIYYSIHINEQCIGYTALAQVLPL
jgi:hypothetical protein